MKYFAKIAFDLHGVVEKYPKHFKKMFNNLKMVGFDVGIISGPPTKQIYAELRSIGIDPIKDVNFVYSIVDFLAKRTKAKMYKDDNGNWWTDDLSWWSSKGKICKLSGVDILFDDSKQYFEYLPKETKGILLNDKDLTELIKYLDKIG